MIQDNPVWYSSEIPGHHTAFGSGLQASGIPSAGFPDTAGPLRAKARTRNRTALFFLLQTHIIVTSNTEKEKKTAQVGMEERITMEENHDKDTREDPEPLTDEEFERFQKNIQKKGLLQKHKNLQQPHSYV
jgi:hypothetical protein